LKDNNSRPIKDNNSRSKRDNSNSSRGKTSNCNNSSKDTINSSKGWNRGSSRNTRTLRSKTRRQNRTNRLSQTNHTGESTVALNFGRAFVTAGARPFSFFFTPAFPFAQALRLLNSPAPGPGRTKQTGLACGLPEIRKGEDLAKSIVAAARKAGLPFAAGDVLVVAQKIVSKAEGLLVSLGNVTPSAKAQALAAQLKKDPRAIELVLRESRRILRSDRVLIAETHHGFVCANAGVDHSNVPGDDLVTLLPRDPDGSAEKLAAALRKITGKRIAVIITDTFGRPW